MCYGVCCTFSIVFGRLKLKSHCMRFNYRCCVFTTQNFFGYAYPCLNVFETVIPSFLTLTHSTLTKPLTSRPFLFTAFITLEIDKELLSVAQPCQARRTTLSFAMSYFRTNVNCDVVSLKFLLSC